MVTGLCLSSSPLIYHHLGFLNSLVINPTALNFTLPALQSKKKKKITLTGAFSPNP